jgi:diguanylate cyclase (GGDEF)-like protein
MQALLDWLLTTDPAQRTRLAQTALALLVMAAGVLGMQYLVIAGVAPARAVGWWTAASVGGLLAAWLLIRSGFTRRFAVPSLALPQMVYSIALAAWAYGLLGPARGAVFPIVMVILMFGIFAASPGQMRWISLYAVALFAGVMWLMAQRLPAVYVPQVEIGHFVMVATMMPAVSILAGRLSRLRHRMRQQRMDLKHAFARIEELATRDTLTGLVNRRHMEELLERERQRSMRSGHVFCIAVVDLDRFKRINEAHGMNVGDEMLRLFAREALATLRVADRIGRWGGESFVLMLSDSRATFARGGIDRLRERIAAVALPVGDRTVRLTLSAGLTEHRAGETVQQALGRAQAALAEAKALGRDRVVVG